MAQSLIALGTGLGALHLSSKALPASSALWGVVGSEGVRDPQELDSISELCEETFEVVLTWSLWFHTGVPQSCKGLSVIEPGSHLGFSPW